MADVILSKVPHRPNTVGYNRHVALSSNSWQVHCLASAPRYWCTKHNSKIHCSNNKSCRSAAGVRAPGVGMLKEKMLNHLGRVCRTVMKLKLNNGCKIWCNSTFDTRRVTQRYFVPMVLPTWHTLYMCAYARFGHRSAILWKTRKFRSVVAKLQTRNMRLCHAHNC